MEGGPEVAYGHFDPDICREGSVVVHNDSLLPQQWDVGEVVAAGQAVFKDPSGDGSRCSLCKRKLAAHSAALAELPSLGGAMEEACPECGLLPDAAYGSTSQARARDTVERYAERLLREQDFSVTACVAFLRELQLAWEMEPQCARPDRRRRRNASAERRRMIFGAFRYGGMTGVTNLTRLRQGTARYLNTFLKRRCEGVSAESWNALQVSFSTSIAVHRDSQNVKGTHNFLYCSGKYKARCGLSLPPPWRRIARAKQNRLCGRTKSIPRVFRALR